MTDNGIMTIKQELSYDGSLFFATTNSSLNSNSIIERSRQWQRRGNLPATDDVCRGKKSLPLGGASAFFLNYQLLTPDH